MPISYLVDEIITYWSFEEVITIFYWCVFELVYSDSDGSGCAISSSKGTIPGSEYRALIFKVR